jgi:hypothetical protein
MRDDDVLYRRLACCVGELLDGATFAFRHSDTPCEPGSADGSSLNCARTTPNDPGTPNPQGA